MRNIRIASTHDGFRFANVGAYSMAIPYKDYGIHVNVGFDEGIMISHNSEMLPEVYEFNRENKLSLDGEGVKEAMNFIDKIIVLQEDKEYV